MPPDNRAVAPPLLTDGLSQHQFQTLRKMLREAGIRLIRESNRYYLTSKFAKGMFVNAKPLQNATGKLRGDALKSLTKLGIGLNEGEANEIPESLRNRILKVRRQDSSTWNVLQCDLHLNEDPIRVLRGFVDQHVNVRLYRIFATDAFHRRDAVWRILERIHRQRESFSSMLQRNDLPEGSPVLGHVALRPAYFVLAPLISRQEPLAAVVTTRRNVQIVAIPYGGCFNATNMVRGGLRVAGYQSRSPFQATDSQ